MAFTGPAARADAWIEVVDRPYEGPSSSLPKLPERRKWHPQVVAWWDTVRKMPHCVLWGPSDWVFALETAYMKQDWWSEYLCDVVHSTKSTEIRRREDQMGTTVEARRKLHLRYVEMRVEEDEDTGTGAGADTPGGDVVDIKSRRKRVAAG